MAQEQKENTTSTVMKEKSQPEKEGGDSTAEFEEEWLIRPCDIYWDEYKECTKFRSRFHQYFIYGETLDCHQWRKDYDNCCKWTDKKDLKAANTLVESEKTRRLNRLRNHYKNDVWKKRDSPPSNWNAPLPEWLVERDKNTYLAARAQEIREGKDFKEHSSCSIM